MIFIFSDTTTPPGRGPAGGVCPGAKKSASLFCTTDTILFSRNKEQVKFIGLGYIWQQRVGDKIKRRGVEEKDRAIEGEQ